MTAGHGCAKLCDVAELVTGTGVKKSYGPVEVLTDATFSIPEGITGLLGGNGAGKTTLIGMVLGLNAIDGGEITVFGKDPASAGPEIRARLGYSPEHHTLPGETQAMDFVAHIAKVHGLPPMEAISRASDALGLVGLGEERFRPMGTMSTGQRQRVKLAQALAHDPLLVFLDEPTDGLDPIQREEMLALIRDVWNRYGISVVVSSHLLAEVERICDSVVIIGDGRVLASGAVAELRGEGTGVNAELDDRDRDADVVSWLRERGLTARILDGGIRVEGVDDNVYDLVIAACVELGVGLQRFSGGTISLEDVFLERMR